jgi:hypothetical protein
MKVPAHFKSAATAAISGPAGAILRFEEDGRADSPLPIDLQTVRKSVG